MDSPALIHKNRILAMAAAAASAAAGAVATAAAPVAQAAGHLLDVMLAALDTAHSELKNMTTQAERQEAKRTRYIPQFEKFVADYLAAGEVYANQVLVWFTLWLLDVRDIERALHLAEICISQGQAMPERFNRDMQTVVADEIFDWAEQCNKDEKSAAPYFDTVLHRVLNGEWRVHEAVQVKFAKLAGDMLAGQDKQAAVEMYKTAQKIAGSDAGVKTKLATLEKALAKSAGAPATESPQ